jgi:hypothetical protein
MAPSLLYQFLRRVLRLVRAHRRDTFWKDAEVRAQPSAWHEAWRTVYGPRTPGGTTLARGGEDKDDGYCANPRRADLLLGLRLRLRLPSRWPGAFRYWGSL